jgi:hypothetical protein
VLKFSVFIKLLVLLIWSCNSFGSTDCYIRVLRSLADVQVRSEEEGLLRAFNINRVATGSIHSLSTQTFLVTDAAGIRYVVRVPLSRNGGWFESFANRFINQAENTRAPGMRVLQGPEAKQVIDKIKNSNDKIKEAFQTVTSDFYTPESKARYAEFMANPEVTVAIYYSGLESGKKYLADIGAFDPMRTYLVDIGNSSLAVVGRDLAEFQANATLEQRKLLVEDIRSLFPGLPITEANLFSYFAEHWRDFRAGPIGKLDTIGINRIPKAMQVELADAQAIWTVLGIPDFHPANWLTDGESILSIDLAMGGSWFKNGDPAIEKHFQSLPFGKTYNPSPRVQEFIYRNVSDKLLHFLESLSAEEVINIAKESNFPITEGQVQGILARAKAYSLQVAEIRAR